MECSVVGTRRVDMKDQEGRETHGWSVFVTREEDGVNGMMADRLFVRDELLRRDTGGVVPNPGDTMEFEYNNRGKLGKIVALG